MQTIRIRKWEHRGLTPPAAGARQVQLFAWPGRPRRYATTDEDAIAGDGETDDAESDELPETGRIVALRWPVTLRRVVGFFYVFPI